MDEQQNVSRIVEDFAEIRALRKNQATYKINFVDKQFPPELFLAGWSDRKIVMKRIKDVDETAELYDESATKKGTIEPGDLSNPHFTAALMCIAYHPKLLNYIFPKGQNTRNSDCNGFFYFRFWKMGKWVYVYVDDKLPFYEDKKFHKPKPPLKSEKNKIPNEISEGKIETSESDKANASKCQNDSCCADKNDMRESCAKSAGKSENSTEDNKDETKGHIECDAPKEEAKNEKTSSRENSKLSDMEQKILKQSEELPDQRAAMAFTRVIGQNGQIFYWASFLEKAYSKFLGGYQHLKDRAIERILLDMTGGIFEEFGHEKKITSLDLKNHFDKHSLILAIPFSLSQQNEPHDEGLTGDSVDADGAEQKSKIEYCTVTGVSYVDFTQIDGLHKMVAFVRMDSSCGAIEWKQPWLDAINEWKEIHKLSNTKMETRCESEFYLTYNNFLKAFPVIKIWLIADGFNFNCEGYTGQWAIPRQNLATKEVAQLSLHKSPQHIIYIRDPNEHDDPDVMVETSASLVFDEQCSSESDALEPFMLVYNLENQHKLRLDFSFFRFREAIVVLNLKQNRAKRFTLPTGRYLAVLAALSNLVYSIQRDYLLRITLPAKFHAKPTPELLSSFESYGCSVDLTNYFDSAETIEETVATEEDADRDREPSQKTPRKDKTKGKKKKMKN